VSATRHIIGPEQDLPPGSRTIVELDGASIGIFNIAGRLYAIRNSCPHRGAPLCEGTIGGTMLPSEPHRYVYGMEDRLLRCPWHGWEIDISTGRPFFDPNRARVRTYDVAVVEGKIVVSV
jgi:3-phenylpropionate/trans-cinnamate dioxygenase ferredoxin subunit